MSTNGASEVDLILEALNAALVAADAQRRATGSEEKRPSLDGYVEGLKTACDIVAKGAWQRR